MVEVELGALLFFCQNSTPPEMPHLIGLVTGCWVDRLAVEALKYWVRGGFIVIGELSERRGGFPPILATSSQRS